MLAQPEIGQVEARRPDELKLESQVAQYSKLLHLNQQKTAFKR